MILKDYLYTLQALKKFMLEFTNQILHNATKSTFTKFPEI